MEELMQVIMQRWDSDEGGRAKEHIPGGLWADEAPQHVLDSGKTYATYFIMDGGFSDTFTSTIEMPVIQFSIFSTDNESGEANNPVWTARDDLVAVFDNVLMDMEPDADKNERRMIQMRRLGFGNKVKEPEQGWACHIQYQCQFTFDK